MNFISTYLERDVLQLGPRIPAVMLTDTANFRNPHYHRPTDTIDTLNLDFMVSVAEAVTAAIIDLAGVADT